MPDLAPTLRIARSGGYTVRVYVDDENGAQVSMVGLTAAELQVKDSPLPGAAALVTLTGGASAVAGAVDWAVNTSVLSGLKVGRYWGWFKLTISGGLVTPADFFEVEVAE